MKKHHADKKDSCSPQPGAKTQEFFGITIEHIRSAIDHEISGKMPQNKQKKDQARYGHEELFSYGVTDLFTQVHSTDHRSRILRRHPYHGVQKMPHYTLIGWNIENEKVTF